MKHSWFFFLAFFFVASFNSNAQEKSKPNLMYFKLCVTNEKGEILLVKYKGIWEPMGRKYDQFPTVKQYIDEMGDDVGIKLKDHRLGALVDQYYNQSQKPMVFCLFEAKYESGDIKVPPGCTGISWYPIDEALKLIPFESMVEIMDLMLIKDNKALWAGGIRIDNTVWPHSKIVETEEEWYKLNGN
jgi:hypothetical protein